MGPPLTVVGRMNLDANVCIAISVAAGMREGRAWRLLDPVLSPRS
jgi:hypothetical protein